MMARMDLSLAELIEKGPDRDPLRDMLQFMCQRMMKSPVERRCNAALGARKPGERKTRRDGYRDREWETRAGTISQSAVDSASALRPAGAGAQVAAMSTHPPPIAW